MSTDQKIIKHNVGLLRLAEELGNISRACKVMGDSRDTFYRYRAAVEEGGVEALLESSRRKPSPEKPCRGEYGTPNCRIGARKPPMLISESRSESQRNGPCVAHQHPPNKRSPE